MIFGGSPIMKLKYVAGGAFMLNTLLYGSYYAISKEVLGRVDPIVFSFWAMMALVPPALIILALSWRHMTRQAVKSGFILGSWLCLALFMLAVALRYNSATGTAFFPALNGLLATLFTWLFLRQPITKTTWFAGVVSVTGAVLLMANADMGGIRGSLIAFLGGLFCTLYIFLTDHFLVNHTKDNPAIYWPLLAVELLTMALWGNLMALLFGDWSMVHFELPKDAIVILYIGLGTVCFPTLMAGLLQKHISPVTVSFITILEPLLGAVVAFLYLHEILPFDGYLGGGLIVAGVLIHTCGSLERPAGQPALRERLALIEKRLRVSRIALLLYPLICCGIGAYIVSRLGGFPPPAWRDLFQSIPLFSTMIQQGQTMKICIIVAQSLSWLIAWSALLLMGGIAIYRALEEFSIIVGWNKAFTPYTAGEAQISEIEAGLTPGWQYQQYVSNLQGETVAVGPGLPKARTTSNPTQEATPLVFDVSSMPTQPPATREPIPVGSGLAPDLQMDVRLLRQMGYTPYSVSARSTKRKLDPVVLQQRRFQRRIRLAQAQSSTVTEQLPDELSVAVSDVNARRHA